jgi:2-oxo-4-hydroxy-4-carboxy-5-ureidoimidazoline decarboxylase
VFFAYLCEDLAIFAVRNRCALANLHTTLERLNLLPITEAEKELLKCCGSREWATRLLAERPFESMADVIAKADRVWWSLASPDWLEAFHSHPKIGEKKAAAATSLDAQKWSADEQSGIRNSARETMEALAELNQAYEEKFGYIFIVCASGKTSEEMLAILRSRLENDADQELRIAAAEQAQITELRLKKLIDN